MDNAIIVALISSAGPLTVAAAAILVNRRGFALINARFDEFNRQLQKDVLNQ